LCRRKAGCAESYERNPGHQGDYPVHAGKHKIGCGVPGAHENAQGTNDKHSHKHNIPGTKYTENIDSSAFKTHSASSK
jgi:hypothetical protein